MGEKRKPIYTILLKKTGKRSHKIELYDKAIFSQAIHCERLYRVRVDGRWFPPANKYGRKFYRSYEIRDLVWKSLHKNLTATP